MSTALITGASGGIGLELAREMAKAKHNLVLVARSADKLQSLAHELRQTYNVQVRTMAKDLADMQQVRDLYAELQRDKVQIDYLVNNAGFGDYAFFHEAAWNKLEGMIDLNMKSLTLLCHLFVQDMVQRGSGKIMNVASTAAFQPGPTMAVYYATKSYVLLLSEAMANELKDKGVTVTALCPGATESGFQAVAALEESRLVKGRKLPTSAEVAAYGYKAMMKGKMVAIHGFMNALMVFSVRFTPRNIVTKIARYVQDKAQ
jgi:hypothetical protein